MEANYSFFFNKMKTEISNINYHLYEITKIYESLITSIETFDNLENEDKKEKEGQFFLKLKFIEFMKDYNMKIHETTILKNKINNMIQENCEHTYIYDTIDSGLDNSVSIEYCNKCYKVLE
jgi:hypothetical protein